MILSTEVQHHLLKIFNSFVGGEEERTSIISQPTEPAHDKTSQNDTYAQRRLRSAQSGQTLPYALNWLPRNQGFFMRTANTLIRLDGCLDICVFAWRPGNFVDFTVLRLTSFSHMRTTKVQISLRIRAV